METAKSIYLGDLRTEATHLKSGEKICTDAPLDNEGKGAFFSPTDLLATSLGSCMLTIMGIAARTHQINIEHTQVKITKVMAADPRRVSEIHIVFDMPNRSYSDKEKAILKNAAVNCPVAKSLHPDIIQKVIFNYSQEA